VTRLSVSSVRLIPAHGKPGAVPTADPGPWRTPLLVARRLRLLSGLLAVLTCSALLVRLTLGPLLAIPRAYGWEGDAGMALAVAVSTAVWVMSARRKSSLDYVDGLSFAHLLVLCLLVATFEATAMQGHQAWGISWTCVLVIVFALVVPTSPLRTSVASVLGTAISPVMVALAARQGETSIETYVPLVVDAGLASILAIACSRFVSRQIREHEQERKLGSYHLEEVIAKGGMGTVWRAHHRMLLRPAAVKIVQPSKLAKTPGELDRLMLRFEREALATANLESPHTVRLFDFGKTDDGAFYYAMELLDGIDLWELVEEYGPVDPARTVHFLHHACHALKEAHQLGLVHRDIKPANLMSCHLGPDYDFLKVCDFGLVKWHQVPATREALSLTSESAVPGTPAFLSPEAVTGESEVDSRSDVYSLGCVAFWLLTGRLVFQAETTLDMAVRHVREQPAAPSTVAELPIPEELDRLVLDCLAKNPDDRPMDAGALEDRLARFVFEEPWTQERARIWWKLHLPLRDAEREDRMDQASLRPLAWTWGRRERRRKKPQRK
jgi:serine/threonine-protein kinase